MGIGRDTKLSSPRSEQIARLCIESPDSNGTPLRLKAKEKPRLQCRGFG
jgi:hypothetical protein